VSHSRSVNTMMDQSCTNMLACANKKRGCKTCKTCKTCFFLEDAKHACLFLLLIIPVLLFICSGRGALNGGGGGGGGVSGGGDSADRRLLFLFVTLFRRLLVFFRHLLHGTETEHFCLCCSSFLPILDGLFCLYLELKLRN
jgi:hypothetical protein